MRRSPIFIDRVARAGVDEEASRGDAEVFRRLCFLILCGFAALRDTFWNCLSLGAKRRKIWHLVAAIFAALHSFAN